MPGQCTTATLEPYQKPHGIAHEHGINRALWPPITRAIVTHGTTKPNLAASSAVSATRICDAACQHTYGILVRTTFMTHEIMEDPIELARRATLRRRLLSESVLPSDDRYAPGVDFPADGDYTADLYFRLALANLLLTSIGSNDIALTPSRVPFIHGWIDRIKRMFHDLALNYVRRLALRQSEVNHNLVRVLNEVVAVSALRNDGRLEALEKRLEALEQRATAVDATREGSS